MTLGAEFIANDRPFYVEYEGNSYFPVFVNYPETAFGGDFETEADYRDPFLQKLIKEKGGTMIWPPIRYSYDTHNLELPTPAPSPPTWMLTEEQCKAAVARKGLKSCGDLETNWLGTDDQGRDVVARLIYGFRISVLFGLVLTLISSIIGVAAGAVQGYFGGWVDLLFQRFIEIWTAIPSLYLLLIISSVLVPGFFVLLGFCCCSPGCRWSDWCARNFCAVAISNTSRRPARSASRMASSSSAICCRTPWWRP